MSSVRHRQCPLHHICTPYLGGLNDPYSLTPHYHHLALLLDGCETLVMHHEHSGPSKLCILRQGQGTCPQLSRHRTCRQVALKEVLSVLTEARPLWPPRRYITALPHCQTCMSSTSVIDIKLCSMLQDTAGDHIQRVSVRCCAHGHGAHVGKLVGRYADRVINCMCCFLLATPCIDAA